MNFTPNQAQALAGRVQQQQVHQNPVTTSSSGAPPGANMQKSGSQPFPVNQQPAQKLNDDKNQIPPTSAHQIQMPPQNNNNHGMAGPPHQILNAQHQQNLNRNVNLGSQPFQQQPHMLPSMTAQGGQKINQNFFHQMQQQVAYQQNQFQSVALSQSQQPHHSLPSQSILQKLQASSQQPLLKQQLPQQSMKPVTIQPPPVVSQHMQYSPSKPVHPQMKTTAKLASPGSQLQIIQKSPTAPNAPLPITQQASPQNKTVPSTPPTNAAAVPAVPPVLNAAAPPPLSPVKPQTQITPVKQPPVQSAPLAPTPVSTNASPVVPSPAVTITPQVKAIPAPVSVTEQSPAKPVEVKLSSPQQNKSVPKAIVEEKKPVAALNNAPPAQETNNKVEVVPVAVPEKAQPPKPVAASTAPIKSTMRLATVTPPRQKKPPATIKKTVTSVTTAASSPAPMALVAQKSPAKVAAPAAKPAESPKSPAKRPQAAAPQPAATPKSNPAPSTSSAQSNSSSNSATISPKTKRPRVKVQPYQSPTPELALVTKLSTQIANSSNKNGNDEKLTLFYKNEFLAVRNPEGTFYLCQAAHNVYKPASKIRIRWLNEGKPSADGDRTYTFDFFDVTDFECVLTTVDLDKIDSKNYELSKEEQTRIESILKKAIDVEKGIVPRPTVTEENPDGLDLSLYKDESQLDKLPRKRKRGGKSDESEEDDDDDYEESPRKKKSAKKSPAAKPSRASKKAATYESSESDGENLMEIQKKAKKQAATPRPSTSKASEPMPSTSTATPTSAKGRKRTGKTVEEVAAKITKTTEKLETPKAAPKPKATPKAKPVKKAVAEKASPAAEKPAAEKKVAKKAVEEKPVEPKASPAKPAAAEKTTPVKATPAKKKAPAATKASPASASPADQPSTSRSRNTRSKK